MKIEKVLMVSGLVLVGYFLYKKYNTQKVIDVDVKEVEDKPKTIRLNLNNTKSGGETLKDKVVRDFDTDTYSTIAKPQIRVEKI